MAESPWLHFFPRASDDQNADSIDPPAMNLFCFPHAGGGIATYKDWAVQLPQWIQVVAISLPGRQSRFEEPAVTSLSSLVEAVSDAIGPLLTPCAFFGHSFGAVIAFEVASILQRRDCRGPCVLFASASRPPCSPQDPELTSINVMSETDLLAAAQKFGFLSPEQLDMLLQSPELCNIVLPPLRNDLAMVQQYGGSSDRLSVSILALGGDSDFWCLPEQLKEWQRCTAHPTVLTRSFPGGHFYFHSGSQPKSPMSRIVSDTRLEADSPESNLKQLLQLVASQLLSAVDELPVSILKGVADDFGGLSHTTVLNIVLQQCRRTPQRVAIEDPAAACTHLTYAALREQATRLARHLQQRCGLEGCAVVACLMPHSASLIAANLAIFLAGGAVSLLEAGYTAPLISELVTEARASCILVAAEWLPKLPAPGQLPCPVVVLAPTWMADLENADAAGDLPPLRAVAVGPSDVAYLTMTSGTTGRPKVVYTSHEGAVDAFMPRLQRQPYRTDLRMADGTGTVEREGFNVFFIWECLKPLLCGQTAVVIPDTVIYDPRALAAFIKRHRIHRCMVSSSLLANLLENSAIDLGGALGHMTMLLLEGEVVPSSLVQQWAARLPAVKLINIYSTWECLDAFDTDLAVPPDHRLLRPNAAVGDVLPNVHAYLVDSRLRPVPRGVEGELCIARPGLRGYSDPALTATKFIANPFVDSASADARYQWLYRTGDLAVVLPSGQLEILGRKDSSTVKIRAFKVSTAAVEAAIKDSAAETGVSTACVVPQIDPATAQPHALAAYVVLEASRRADPQSALQHLHRILQAALPAYAVPRYLVPLDAMPLRPGGGRKLDCGQLPHAPTHAVRLHTREEADQAAALAGPRAQSRQLEALVTEAFRAVLSAREVAASDNFFELGGHSLLAAALTAHLAQHLGIACSVLDVYSNPSAAQLAAHLSAQHRLRLATGGGAAGPTASPSPLRRRCFGGRVEVAVVGMAGRFPGAASVEILWREVLSLGATAVRRLSEAELASKGVPSEAYAHPRWVPAAYAVEEAEKFDAVFWGIGRAEAEAMDPQHRLFLQTAWHAVENAGYAPASGLPERTGVFAGCGIEGYLLHHQRGGRLLEPLDPGGIFMTEIGNEKDYISSRVAHQLNCRGPSITVTSACSTGLVAISQACAALASGECDAAIAGAAALTFPNLGYLHQQGLVMSSDGVVRPFDSDADGTVFGDAVAAVVLKRREDAEADGDRILAVVKGWGLSNDGRDKAGFAAPSAMGQSRCIEAAMRMADVPAASISYVEAHATATDIGDGIEMQGLRQAYERLGAEEEGRSRSSPTLLGSIKGNIGHANAAAGLTGFIKTVLMLQHRQLVPTANLHTVSPKVNAALEGSPLRVHTGGLQTWAPAVRPDGTPFPLRAGVSSFGIGGSNCHCVLEEHPPATRAPASLADGARGGIGGVHLLTVSGKTEEALVANMGRMAAALVAMGRDAGGPRCGDVAFTSHVGREALRFRFACTFASLEEAASTLRSAAAAFASGAAQPAESRGDVGVAMLLPGHGSEFAGMGRGLYRSWPAFRAAVQRCAEAARPHLGYDLAACVFAGSADPRLDASPQELRRPEGGSEGDTSGGGGGGGGGVQSERELQVALFAVEFAMVEALQGVGVHPAALGGHSLGELAAAAAAEVMPLEAAVALVATRGAIVERSAPPGGMLAVAASEADLRARLGEEARSGVEVAVVNGAGQCVLAGEAAALEEVHAKLRGEGVQATKLPARHAFHSRHVAGAAAELVEAARSIGGPWRAPRVPMTSNATGGWLGDEAMEAGYWGRHMEGCVQWERNMRHLLRWRPAAVVEAGPGGTLCRLVERHCKAEGEPAPLCLQSMPRVHGAHADARSAGSKGEGEGSEGRVEAQSEERSLVELLGRLWELGQPLDWGALHASERDCVRRIELPPYAFARDSFWINPEASIYVDTHRTPPLSPAAAPRPPLPEEHVPEPLAGASSCLVPLRTRLAASGDEGASCTLFCFSYAGGSASAFQQLPEALARRGLAVEVIAVEMPGRGARAEDPPPGSAEEDAAMVAEVAAAVAAHAARDPTARIAFCGLSAGALLALEVLDLLGAGVRERLVAVAVAGRMPPLLDSSAGDDGVAPPPPSGAVDIERCVMAPPGARSSPAWACHFLPLLRSDLEYDERAHSRLSQRLASQRGPKESGGTESQSRTAGSGAVLGGCRLLVCYGKEDALLDLAHAGEWSRLTGGAFSIAAFDGDHSFLVQQAPALFDRVGLELLAATTHRPARSPEQRAAVGGRSDALRSAVYRVEWEAVATVPHRGLDREAEATRSNTDSQPASARDLGPGTDLFCAIADTHVPLPAATLSALAQGGGITLVVWLLGCGSGSGYQSAYETRQAWAVTRLIQECIAADSPGANRLVLLCPAAVEGAQAAGVSKAAAMEVPELRCSRVFLDPALCCASQRARSGLGEGPCGAPRCCTGGTPAAPAAWGAFPSTAPGWAVEAMRAAEGVGLGVTEDDVWLRRSGRRRVVARVPRMVPMEAAESVARGDAEKGTLGAVMSLQRGEKVVVSGGSGGVGSAVVEWLIREKGVAAEDVVVLTRRKQPGRHPLGARQVTVDCGDATRVLQCEELRSLGDVGVVLHLAGRLDDGLVAGMTGERMEEVVRPKAEGMAGLLQLAQEKAWDLRVFVAFSSTSSLLGFPGQANYCAANAVLDAAAAFGAGGDADTEVPWVTINWGAWGEVGMAARSSNLKAFESALRAGDRPLSTGAALAALERILRTVGREGGSGACREARQFAVCDVTDWGASQWAACTPVAALARAAPSRTVAAREGSAGAAPVTQARRGPGPGASAIALKGRLGKGASAGSQEAEAPSGRGGASSVEGFLRERVSGWRPKDTLAALGMDSLDVVQTRSEFNARFQVVAPLSWFTRHDASLERLLADLQALVQQ